jgi:hypothetical protein
MPDRILTYTIGELEGEGPLYMLEIRAVSASRLEMVMEMTRIGEWHIVHNHFKFSDDR